MITKRNLIASHLSLLISPLEGRSNLTLMSLRTFCPSPAVKKGRTGGVGDHSLSGRKRPNTFLRPNVFITFRRKAKKPRAIRAPKNHAPAM